MIVDKIKHVRKEPLNNSLSELVSGIIPNLNVNRMKTSNNMINSTQMLRANLRPEFITIDRPLLSFLYQQYGIIQAAIEVPVYDAFKLGYKIKAFERQVIPPAQERKHRVRFRLWNSDNENPKRDVAGEQFDADQEQYKRREEWESEQLKLQKEQIKGFDEYLRKSVPADVVREIELFVKREKVIEKYKQALVWQRLYGGAGLIILDGRDPATKLDLEKIDKDTDLQFYVADCWELTGTPESASEIRTIDWVSDKPFMVMGHPVHKSRVLVLKGKPFPSLYRTVGRGWGMSNLEPLVRTLNKSVKNENAIFELLDEAKIDIFQLVGFNDAMLDPDSTEGVKKRLNSASALKSYLKALILDSQDVYNQKQIHFNGLADLKIDARVDTASDARITMNKLYGTTPAGFNSGEADRDSYADSVESEIRSPSEGDIIKLLQVCARKAVGKTLDMEWEWAPLIKSTEYESQKVKTLKLANLNEAFMWGKINTSEWIDAVNRQDLLGLEVQYKDKFVPDPMAKNVFKPGFGSSK